MTAPIQSGWPTWIRYTLSAAAGAAGMLVAITIAFADVKHTAEDAGARSSKNERRIEHEIVPDIQALKQREAANHERFRAIKEQLDRIETKVGR